MTTAHRPTWKAAVGRTQESAGGAKTTLKAIRDAPSHTKLKSRILPSHNDNDNDNSNNNKWEASLQKLKKLEEEALKQKNSLIKGPRKLDDQYHTKVEEEARQKLLLSNVDVDDVQIRNKYNDDESSHHDSDNTDLDLDDDSLQNDDYSSSQNSSDEDLSSNNDDDEDGNDDYDSEDEVAALQAELAKIRAEREQAKLKAEAQAKAIQDAELEEAALTGNPLLASSFQNDHTTTTTTTIGDGKLKKRTWNDDVVFRNQAKGEPQIKKRFINDTVRNDFHKRFLDKFIR